MEYLALIESELFVAEPENQEENQSVSLLQSMAEYESAIAETEILSDESDDRHSYSYPSLFF